jgi:hypothetical protein
MRQLNLDLARPSQQESERKEDSMSTAVLAAVTGALLVAAGYAQWRIPCFEATRSGAMLTRGVLILIGVAFGFAAVAYYAGPRYPAALVFLSAFGLVHLPAAAILLLKRERGESPS